MTQTRPISVFISYAHKDNHWREKLERHLAQPIWQGILEVWSDRQIDAGRAWLPEIRRKLETADIILLLTSPEFLASKFCIQTELEKAMERHEAGEARVIPVFLRPCDWKKEVFGKLQGVPIDGIPITTRSRREVALRRVADAIGSVAVTLARERARREAEAEEHWWEEVILIETLEAYRGYLKLYPQGKHAAITQTMIGKMYRDGRGVTPDDAMAAFWFHRAAEQGYALAQSKLGEMCRDGRGVPQDDVEAVHWFRCAAEQGNAWGQSSLGSMYRDGRGVPQDDGEAVNWYRKAVGHGDSGAENSLGEMYRDGRGVPQDDVEAVRWFRKAAEQGNPVALQQLQAMPEKV